MISVGDRVRLRSGGPVMKILSLGPAGVVCIWPHGPQFHEHKFPAPALVRATAEPD